ncbi:hypothetical protein L7F22_040559 [Adiantum nelumboides]|nr:hypothetical protein [Adiantum nelumboides]
MLTLAESVYFNVADETSAYKAWTKLCDLYEKQSAASQVYWLKKLVDLKMKEGTPMSNHLNEFNTIYSQLSAQGVSFDADIAFAVGVVSRYMSNPGKKHWEAVKGILRYLKATKDMRICYGSQELDVKGYTDSDYAGNLDNRRSTSGYVFTLAGGAMSWRSRL